MNADKMQDEAFRKMSGEERVAAAFAFSDLIRRVAEEGIRSQHPEFSARQIKEELARRIAFSPTVWKNNRKSLEK